MHILTQQIAHMKSHHIIENKSAKFLSKFFKISVGIVGNSGLLPHILCVAGKVNDLSKFRKYGLDAVFSSIQGDLSNPDRLFRNIGMFGDDL